MNLAARRYIEEIADVKNLFILFHIDILYIFQITEC
jgi:hypothetical protein